MITCFNNVQARNKILYGPVCAAVDHTAVCIEYSDSRIVVKTVDRECTVIDRNQKSRVAGALNFIDACEDPLDDIAEVAPWCCAFINRTASGRNIQGGICVYRIVKSRSAIKRGFALHLNGF